MARVESANISFWDALVVEAALVAGATRLLTEDLQHGQIFDGWLRVETPYHP
jgi:predicted nucleic acid-binding protein